MRYKILEKELFIDGFWVNTRSNEDMSEINDIKPTKDHELNGLYKYEYRNVNLKVTFNGSLLLARDFIDSEYIHMGYQSPTAYRIVLKFDFENGIIVNVEDKSKLAEKAREEGDPKGYRPQSMVSKDLNEWIANRFSLELPPLKTEERDMEEVKNEMLKELERLKNLKKDEE
ncbi:MAG: hypothetical protein EU541_02455 [Promethearchaeota archaeon]|nr:MAG: hypothetical protein EU541_02455 [Candidatus Lokiarchaeota archaeon]